MLSSLLKFVPILCLLHTWQCEYAEGRLLTDYDVRARHTEAAKRFSTQPRCPTSPHNNIVKNVTFSNPRASEFYVDGTTIPEVDFDIGPSWSGSLPISGDPNETRKLFFWFFPPGPQGSEDDLIFWTNGGPGCSALEGMLQENGPFTWRFGQARPTPNEFSWTNLSNVLYIDQPVGAGYSQGVPNAKDEHDVSAQLVGFLQQFLEVFSELKGKKFYLTGESFAGRYIPYLANYIYENTTTATLDLSLKGFWITDPLISWDVVQRQIPAASFVHKYEHVFSLNRTALAFVDSVADACGYANYTAQHLTYPPKGVIPLPRPSHVIPDKCRIWEDIVSSAEVLNPAFNIYRIFDTFPVLWDVLGRPGTHRQIQTPIYFDRQDVKQAIHAPLNMTWKECNKKVFPDGDKSLPPVFTVLPNAIEKSERSVIVHGLADFVLIAEGTRIAIQNMTWDGKQGFQTPIEDDSFSLDGVGAFGTMHSERGLTYYEVILAGHMLPQFSPKAALQTMEYLMGFRASP